MLQKEKNRKLKWEESIGNRDAWRVRERMKKEKRLMKETEENKRQ